MFKIGDKLRCIDTNPFSNRNAAHLADFEYWIYDGEYDEDGVILVKSPNNEYLWNVPGRNFELFDKPKDKIKALSAITKGDLVKALGTQGKVLEVREGETFTYKVVFEKNNVDYVVLFTKDGKLQPWMKESVLEKI